ncbi:PP2C family protein-serine/threonine phosphatase [Ornithinimicrobium sp. Y1694]|uniref:PP2C family protein-serine/threonine phosphatase n=1 Tax=Ornithinimicrobium sp. Y1694 TaxID=3418590 RepID=UPI003CE72F7C
MTLPHNDDNPTTPPDAQHVGENPPPDAHGDPETTPPNAQGDPENTPQDAQGDIVPLDPPDPIDPDLPVDGPTYADQESEPEPFSDGPPPLPEPMLVLDGDLNSAPPADPEPEPEDHGTCRCGGAFDADGWCTECGERRPDPRHHFSSRPTDRVAAVCDRGIRHTDNEDAMAVWADEQAPDLRAALVVCDGVSSAPRSAEASLAASYAALEVLTTSDALAQERLQAATKAAADAVAEVGEEFGESAPSCTIVLAVVEADLATVGNVGDSRAYWFPDEGEPLRLTRDDSMAEEQVDAGIDRATAEAGPLAHTITRWLGPDAHDQHPRVVTQEVTSTGWLMLCSDGLWNYASEPADLRAVLREAERAVGQDPLDLGQHLVDWANGKGGADNITVALARTGPASAQPDAAPTDPSGQDGNHG